MLWCYYYQYCLICFGALFTAHPVYTAALLYVVIINTNVIIVSCYHYLYIVLVDIKELRVETHRVRTHFKLI